MAIANGMFYDPSRDMYYDRQQREMQHQYEMMQAQQRMYNAQQQQLGGQRPVEVVDPNDPLAFLKKSDKTLLLTGEA